MFLCVCGNDLVGWVLGTVAHSRMFVGEPDKKKKPKKLIEAEYCEKYQGVV